jgi:hypothetical protein
MLQLMNLLMMPVACSDSGTAESYAEVVKQAKNKKFYLFFFVRNRNNKKKKQIANKNPNYN